MKHCFHTLIIAILAVITACSSQTDVPQTIDEAEHFAAVGEYTNAIAMCDRLVTTADSANLTATQLCRIGVLYAVAADHDVDNAVNTARAMHSFIKANALNSDSVAAFVDKIRIEDQSAVRTVLQLLRYQDDDLSNFEDLEDLEGYAAQLANDEEDLDSIYEHEQ